MDPISESLAPATSRMPCARKDCPCNDDKPNPHRFADWIIIITSDGRTVLLLRVANRGVIAVDNGRGGADVQSQPCVNIGKSYVVNMSARAVPSQS